MQALKTALINIRRTPYQAFVAMLMMSLTFFVAYSLSFTLLGADKVLNFFETRPQVIGFFKLGARPTDIQKTEQELQSKDYVKEIIIVNKEEALALYQQDNQENPLLLELVTADILPASIEVSTNTIDDLKQIESYLKSDLNIEEVVLQQDIIDTLASWTNSIRMMGLIIMSALAITSFFIITIIIGLKAAGKKIAIGIMSLIGATSSYIVLPFMYEGAIYSLVGSSLGFGAMWLSLLYATPWLNGFLNNIITLPLPPELFLMQYSFGTAIGIIFGAFASLTAVKKMIKK